MSRVAVRALLPMLLSAAIEAHAQDAASEAALSPAMKYSLYCGGCHGLDGRGDIRADVPPLPPNVGALLKDPEGRRYLTQVGGIMSTGLDASDTAIVLNYVLRTFGKDSVPADARDFDANEVAALREKRVQDPVALRRQIVARLKAQDIAVPEYPWP